MSYEINIQLDNGSLDGTTEFVLPDPLPVEDGNGIIQVDVPPITNVGVLNLFGLSRYNDTTPWWVFYIQVESPVGLGVDDYEVGVRPAGSTVVSRVFVDTGVTAAPALSRANGPVIPRGARLTFEAIAQPGGTFPQGDHRIFIAAEPLLDGEECCAYQAGQNVFSSGGLN